MEDSSAGTQRQYRSTVELTVGRSAQSQTFPADEVARVAVRSPLDRPIDHLRHPCSSCGRGAVTENSLFPVFQEHDSVDVEEQENPERESATGGAPVLVTVTLPFGQEKERLDRLVARELGLTRSFATKLIRRGHVVVSPPERIKPSLQCGGGTVLQVTLPPPQRLELEPEPVPFGVVFADQDCLVIHKPAGVVVHPAPGHWKGTLVHGLLYAFPDIGSVNGIVRPGIVHRLDVGTSG